MLLKFSIKEFISDREFKNLAPSTIKGYKIFFRTFEEFCIENEIVNVNDITTSTIKSYLLECKKKRDNNPTSINTKLKNLKAFFNYLVEEEIISEKNNPTTRIKFVKEDTKIEVFSDNDIKQMLSYYQRMKYREKSFYAYRDHTIIVVLLGTGIRLGELINLRWKDIAFDDYSITVYGKLREYSSIPMTDKLRNELREYNVYCSQNFKILPDYVFTDRYEKQLSPDAVKNIFKRLKKIMNFKDVRLSAHTFRHTFAHRCLMAGMDVFTLQKMLRHKNISMTERYLAIWGTALKEQNDKFNPLNNINI